MDNRIYKWKDNTSFFNKYDANKIGKEIETIATVSRKSIVDKARDKKTELHKAFEWDDSKAGELYRQQQAGTLLTCLQVVIKTSATNENEIKSTTAFVTLKRDSEFEPIEAVVSNPEKLNILYERAVKQFKADRERYKEVEELQELFNLIDEL